jgi:hypothetical protein
MTDNEIRRLTRGLFTKKELECRCGICSGECDMSPRFLEKLTVFRLIYGVPFTPNSAYRCPKHPLLSENHLGYAVDVPCRSSNDRWRIINAAIKAGFTRIGIGKDFVHIDCTPEHMFKETTKQLIWIY